MSHRNRNRVSHTRRDEDYGQRQEIVVYLTDGPRTIEEISDHYQSYLRFLGLFNLKARLEREPKKIRIQDKVRDCLRKLIADGWVVETKDRYQITDQGRKEAKKMVADLQEARDVMGKAIKPEKVSRVSLAIHLVLAAIKLSAGLLSGSVGLLNDAFDTLLDGLSSLLVYFGIRSHRERLVNFVLVILMLGTGIFTLIESINRLIHPEPRSFSWLALGASMISLVVCGLLGAYQYFVGKKSGMLVLITQSLDSRNHVLVASGVIIGLVFISFDVMIIDTLVGLAVSILILKSGIELMVDLWNAGKDGETDLSRYELGIIRNYQNFRIQQLGDWMLYMVERDSIQQEQDLINKASASLDFEANPTLRELGWAQSGKDMATIQSAKEFLYQNSYLEFLESRIHLTEKGKDYLDSRMNHFNRRIFRQLDKGTH